MSVLGRAERLETMPTPDPQPFADQWVRAWNAHDVEAVLDHFADDVVFTSPVAARVVPGSGGVVRGKAALRDYWTTALTQQPEWQADEEDPTPGESHRQEGAQARSSQARHAP